MEREELASQARAPPGLDGKGVQLRYEIGEHDAFGSMGKSNKIERASQPELAIHHDNAVLERRDWRSSDGIGAANQ